MSRSFKSKWAAWLFVMACTMLSSSLSIAEIFDATSQDAQHVFTHSETGFQLTGAHLIAECSTCHVGGVMKGTPRNCAGCHTRGARVLATPMPTNHIVTNEACDVCHTNASTFLGARFNHGSAQAEACATCHNGRISTGKPANHNTGLRLTNSCASCHRTVSWYPANFNHTGVAPGTCAAQCHNGLATPRPTATHSTALRATKECDTCHRYFAWQPTFYDHSAVVIGAGTCGTCHDGNSARAKPGSHTGLKGMWACDQCHTNTASWIPARYNHLTAVPGGCSSCHNGGLAIGKPGNHIGARLTLACDSCHTTAAWFPAMYNHIGIAPGTCLTCHTAQRPTSHNARGYISSCDACHSIGAAWTFNHAQQQGKHTCNNCHSRRDHHGSGSLPCDYCHSVNGWGG